MKEITINNTYNITGHTLNKILEALRLHMFTVSDGEDFNNEEVIDAIRSLEEEIFFDKP
jgi:hypothetical protein